jgi:hypothetical protein
MKLLAYTINGQTIGIDIGVWGDAMLSGNTAFMAIADTGSTPTDYVDISSTANWGDFGGMTTLSDAEIKAEIVKLIPDVPTADEYLLLEDYANVGLNAMTNIDEGVTIGSVLSGKTYLTGVTDTKLAVTGGSSGGVTFTTGKVLAEQAYFSGETNVGWWLYADRFSPLFEPFIQIGQMNSTEDLLYMREGNGSGLAGSEFSGIAVKNADGAGNAYLMGVDTDGVLKIGWSGGTLQPVSTGSTGSGGTVTTYSTTSSGGVTTASPTDVLMDAMEITSVPAGNYFLSFGTSFNHSSNGSSILTTIYVGGAAVTGSEQAWTRGNAQGNVYGTHNYAGFPITLATTATVEIRWQTDNATATSTNRYMSLIKV